MHRAVIVDEQNVYGYRLVHVHTKCTLCSVAMRCISPVYTQQALAECIVDIPHEALLVVPMTSDYNMLTEGAQSHAHPCLCDSFSTSIILLLIAPDSLCRAHHSISTVLRQRLWHLLSEACRIRGSRSQSGGS